MSKMKCYIQDVYPLKAQFMSKEEIALAVELFNEGNEEDEVLLKVKLCYLDRVEEVQECKIILYSGEVKKLVVKMTPRESEFTGYGVDVYLYHRSELIQIYSSSFDVVSDWRKSTRYGFLSDFYVQEKGDVTDIENLAKLHLNMVQFYDWMYKHDELVAPIREYKDLMGRNLSLDVVEEKVALCHRYGMKAIAYGAVYAASYDFYCKHKEWALYKSNDEVYDFINIFYIMNIAPECPWHQHIIAQYKNAIEQVGFDGIHMDTYGFPKVAISKLNNTNKIERMEEHFPVLIHHTRKELEKSKKDVGLIFNAVGNWPVRTVASAVQDAVYIEVWEPYERYHHIQYLIQQAKYLNSGKPVILAAYLAPFREEAMQKEKAEIAALILTAVIAANGGYHLLLGEKNGVLTQGYYVDYSTVDDAFMRLMRNYYDFIIRYMNVLFDNALEDVSMTHVDGDNLEYEFENISYSTYGEPNKVWVTVREKVGCKAISFINLTGNHDDFWNKGKDKPRLVENIQVKIAIIENVQSVFVASPDYGMGRPQKLNFSIEDGKRGKTLIVNIPKLYLWSLLVVEFE